MIMQLLIMKLHYNIKRKIVEQQIWHFHQNRNKSQFKVTTENVPWSQTVNSNRKQF